MKEGQKEIYFASGSSKEAVLNLPQYEAVKTKGYDVLVLNDHVDEFMLQVLREYDKVTFKNINSNDLDLLNDEEKKALSDYMERELSSLKKLASSQGPLQAMMKKGPGN